jgi:uncharacterized membrane protein
MAQNDETATRFFEKGVRIAAGVTIQRRAVDLFQAWHTFEALPRFIDDLQSVRRTGNGLEWTVKGPGGGEYSWTATIIHEKPSELIAWRSSDDGVLNAGSIRFRELPYCRGTEVRAVIEYVPPGGSIGSTISKAAGDKPEIMLRRALLRFRQLMESGEVATTVGQPVGAGRDQSDIDSAPDTDLRDLANKKERP